MTYFLIGMVVLVPFCVLVLRPIVQRKIKDDPQVGRLEVLIGPVLTLAIFLCSFMGFQTTTAYQTARANTAAEGVAIEHFFETAVFTKSDVGRSIQAATLCYARSITWFDWQATVRGDAAPETDEWALRIDEHLADATSLPIPIFSRLLSSDTNVSNTRYQRLATVRTSTPALMVLLVGFAVVLGVVLASLFLLPGLRRSLALLLVGAMAFLLCGSLFVIGTLDDPYVGIVSIDPSLLQRVDRNLTEQFVLNNPGVALPCDAEGNPV